MKRPALVFVVTLLLGIPLAAAGASRTAAIASVDRAVVLIGDPIQYRIVITYPQGAVVEWPPLGETLGDWIVEASKAEPPRTEDGITTEARRYRLAGYSTGTHAIPAMVVTFKTGDGATHELRTQAVTVTVKSLLPKDWERQDIRDVKPLIPVRSSWWWLLGGVAVIVGVVGGAWWWSRRQRGVGVSSPPPRPPHVLACEALSSLRREDLPAHNRYEEYYIRLSGIARAYIEARFGVKAPEMTTEEFLQAASNAQALSLGHRRLLQEFLERCDLVKFARYEPSRREADEAFEAAHRFIQDTVPPPGPVAASRREAQVAG